MMDTLDAPMGATTAGMTDGFASGTGATPEVELKLLAPADALARLRETPAITQHARNRGITRHFETIYYDTPEQAFHRHGLSLRVRRHGRTYVQTLKRIPAAGSAFTRAEWERRIGGAEPEPGLLPAGALGEAADTILAQGLVAVFATRVRRRTQRLDFGGSVIEIAFDDGWIEAGERREPVSEIELELKAGEPRALFDLGLELLDVAALRIGTRSKSERGYALALGRDPQAVKATAPALPPGCTVDDIIGVLLGTCQHQLLANEAVATAGRDPEGVHQMRVALRRMRTALSFMQRELALPALAALDDEARWLGRRLGAVRDWDVFATETLAAPTGALDPAVDLDVLRDTAAPHRATAYAALHEALGSPRYARFQLSLQRWTVSRGWRNELVDQPLSVLLEDGARFAGRVLGHLHRRVLRRGRHFRDLPPEGRHGVRLALKRLRYALDFFQDLIGPKKEVKQFLKGIAKLQDMLGHANDAATTRPCLAALAAGDATPGVERGIGAVVGWQARDRIEANATLHRQWRRFKALRPVWAD